MPIVGDGDCAVSIADQLGCNDYHSVWDDGSNSALKGSRPNPNQLVKGDEVKPASKTKTATRAVDSTWVFVVTTKKLPKLSIVIVDKDDKPLAGKAWRLTAPKAASGKTKADGLIEIKDLDPQAKAGTLQFDWQKTKTPAKKAAPKDPEFTKPVYPRPVKASEFKDVNPAAPLPADDTMEWTLKIGSLPAFDHISGVQARLNNLGFRCDPDAQAARTQADVRTYQRTRLKNKSPSGAAADIQTDIRNRHDNP